MMDYKEKVLPLIGQLEQEVAAAQMRVEQLENECPSDWSPVKNELDELFGTVGSNLDRAFQEMSSREVLWWKRTGGRVPRSLPAGRRLGNAAGNRPRTESV